MKKSITSVLAAGIMLAAVSPLSQAVVIGFTPANQTVSLGDSVSVDLFISDFAADESLGDFDLDVSFDNSILGLNAVSFGDQLGFSDQNYSNLGGGVLNLNELSWESIATLAGQSDSFKLATLTFNTLSAGISALNVSNVWALGDQEGSKLGYNLTGGQIEVLDKAAVPEPATLLLLGVGLAGLGISRRKFNA